MTASDKKKTVILVLLLLGAAASWYYVYRPAAGGGPSAPVKAAAKPKPVKIGQDAAIRTDLVPNTSSVDIGRINLFDYRQRQVAVSKQPESTRPAPPPQPSRPIVFDQPAAPPPPQPWRPFKYEGFSVSKNGGKILASITESGVTYEVNEGGCFQQYCVTRLTENLVELEDQLLKRRQTFTRTQVQ